MVKTLGPNVAVNNYIFINLVVLNVREVLGFHGEVGRGEQRSIYKAEIHHTSNK